MEAFGLTEEQEELHRQLVAQYGETIVKQAAELSGLALCLAGLAHDELAGAERARLYQQASLHLGQLLETMMPPAVSAKVAECAKRIDSAVDMAMFDAIEKRDGLPS